MPGFWIARTLAVGRLDASVLTSSLKKPDLLELTKDERHAVAKSLSMRYLAIKGGEGMIFYMLWAPQPDFLQRKSLP